MLRDILHRCTDFLRTQHLKQHSLQSWAHTKEMNDIEIEEYMKLMVAYELIDRVDKTERRIREKRSTSIDAGVNKELQWMQVAPVLLSMRLWAFYLEKHVAEPLLLERHIMQQRRREDRLRRLQQRQQQQQQQQEALNAAAGAQGFANVPMFLARAYSIDDDSDDDTCAMADDGDVIAGNPGSSGIYPGFPAAAAGRDERCEKTGLFLRGEYLTEHRGQSRFALADFVCRYSLALRSNRPAYHEAIDEHLNNAYGMLDPTQAFRFADMPCLLVLPIIVDLRAVKAIQDLRAEYNATQPGTEERWRFLRDRMPAMLLECDFDEADAKSSSKHWILGLVDLKHRRVSILDSLNLRATVTLWRDIVNCWIDTPVFGANFAWDEQHEQTLRVSRHSAYTFATMQQSGKHQENGIDCGFFCCLYLQQLLVAHGYEELWTEPITSFRDAKISQRYVTDKYKDLVKKRLQMIAE
jgi:hypothetical protein